MTERFYKGWQIKYLYNIYDTVPEPKWVVSKGEREIWLNGRMSYDDVLKYINQIEGDD